MAEELERIYIIPLRKVGYRASKAAPTAVKRVKDYLTRHMKVEDEKIWIDESLNNALWAHGKYKMPRKIRVKAVKFDDGVVEAYLPELEFKKSRRELLKEEKAKKEPILKKEEVKEEAPTEEGYEIAPTAGGEVKIKKKKPAKEKETEEKSAEKTIEEKVEEKLKEKQEKKEEKKESKAPPKKKTPAKKKETKEVKPKTKSKSKTSKKKSGSGEDKKK